jgi:hypothetical protein
VIRSLNFIVYNLESITTHTLQLVFVGASAMFGDIKAAQSPLLHLAGPQVRTMLTYEGHFATIGLDL